MHKSFSASLGKHSTISGVILLSDVNKNVLRPFGPAHLNGAHISDEQQRRIARSKEVSFISIDNLSRTAVCRGKDKPFYNVSLYERKNNSQIHGTVRRTGSAACLGNCFLTYKCTCRDFTINLKGSAPCKHIYALADKLGYISEMPFSKSDQVSIAEYISNASNLYYSYLSEHDKGVGLVKITVDPDKKIFGEKLKYTLHFAQNVPAFDFVTHIKIDGEDFSINKFNILESSQRSASVLLSKESAASFNKAENLYLVVDFRSLVLRISEHFSKFKNISFPPIPSLSFDRNMFPNVPFSDRQSEAINNIFSAPLSYVWGAAGSGKTRFVLAYSVLAYLLKGRRVLVTAPTNIALDNALSEVISVGKKYGIKPNVIRRFGVPTQSFAKDHPECCSKYENPQIAFLKEKAKNISLYFSCKKNFRKCTELISQIDSYFAAVDKLNSVNNKIKALTLERNLQLIECNDKECLRSVKNDEVNKLYGATKVFSFKIKKALKFKSALSLENKYNTFLTELKELSTEIVFIKAEISRLDTSISEAKKLADSLTSSSENYKASIRFTANKLANDPMSIPDDFSVLKDKVLDYKKRAEECMIRISSQYSDINFVSIGDANILLSGIESEILRLQQLSDDEILLYGCTLDSLASREPSRKFAHIFLDEACYSCIAKAALVFLYKAPVTFLGDHMQLPPVAEIDNKDLNNKNLSPCFVWAQNGIYSADLFSFDYDKMFKEYINHSLTLPSRLSVSSLNETYRFGVGLANVLNSYIYKNGFRSGINTETCIKVINAPYKRGLNKHENISEAQKIKSYLETAKPSNCVVLSPYVHQADYLKHFLTPLLPDDNILTVHKSQGQEWDTVILSVSDLPEGFLVTTTKSDIAKQVLNTAISRAKKELIIVCDCSEWLICDGELITALIKIGSFVF